MTLASPVFVVGSPRSGSTLFQFLLRQNPAFLCPHETHFFRWNEPYGSTDYQRFVQDNETLIRHRELDGVSASEFTALLSKANDKGELFTAYAELLMEKEGKEGITCVIEKTPQHVYSLALIRRYFPAMKVVHVVRNPLNVVASLLLGRDFETQSLQGALNYWLEAVELIDWYGGQPGVELLEIRYEELVRSPASALAAVCGFMGAEGYRNFDCSMVHEEQNRYQAVLSEDDIAFVRSRTATFAERYGYP